MFQWFYDLIDLMMSKRQNSVNVIFCVNVVFWKLIDAETD